MSDTTKLCPATIRDKATLEFTVIELAEFDT